MKLLNLISGPQFKRSFLAAAVAASCATSAFAALPQFTFNPSSLCATTTCGSVTADNLKIADTATATFSSPTNFTETGYLQVTGFELNALPIAASGFPSNYSLYIPFLATGHLTSANTNPVAGPTNGVFDTLNYQFIGKSGNVLGSSDFITGPGTAATGLLLGTGSLLGGFAFTNPSTSSPGFAPGANVDFKFTPTLTSFFTAPVPFYNMGFSAFVNTTTEITALSNGGFTITAGGGTLNFNSAAVPEPATVALLGLGLLGVAASRRKSAKSKNA